MCVSLKSFRFCGCFTFILFLNPVHILFSMTSTKMLALADALDFIVKGSLYFQSGCQMFPDVTLSVFIVHAVKMYFILNHQNKLI